MGAREFISLHTRLYSVSEWLKEEMNKASMSSAKLAKKMGVSPGQVSDWRNQGMSYKSAMRVSRETKWHLPPLDELAGVESNEGMAASVPITSSAASMGLGLGVDEHEVIRNVRVSKEWLRSRTHSNNLALLPVTGNSMEPTYKSGDTLLVDRAVTAFERDAVYVFRSEAGLFVKRVTRSITGGVVVSSDNKEYPHQTLGQDDLREVQVLGLIVGVWGYKDL